MRIARRGAAKKIGPLGCQVSNRETGEIREKKWLALLVHFAVFAPFAVPQKKADRFRIVKGTSTLHF